MNEQEQRKEEGAQRTYHKWKISEEEEGTGKN